MKPKRNVMSLTHTTVSQNRPNDVEAEPSTNKEEIKKELSLLAAVSTVLSVVVGTGIFVSPKGVVREVRSVGSSLMVWIFCGGLSMIGALCYAELGTSLPKSGGDYAYILEAYGKLPAFLYLWDNLMIFVPTTNAIMSLIFAAYILQPLYNDGCEIPMLAKQLLAGVAIFTLTFLNAFWIKLVVKMHNVLTVIKIVALVTIISVGLIWLLYGYDHNFERPLENMTTDPGKLAVAFYSGIFSFSGWNYINLLSTELKDPYRNLPKALYIVLPLVTVIYVLANTAYLALLHSSEIKISDAVAETFGSKILGHWSFIISLLIGVSSFGCLSFNIMLSSHMCCVGARNGHMPAIFLQNSVYYFTPLPSLIFLCIPSVAMLACSDIYTLITYCSIVEAFFMILSVSALLYFRYSRPDMERPFKVPIFIPILFLIICVALVIITIYAVPYQVAMGVLVTFIGIPFYYVFIKWKSKPQWMLNFTENFTLASQKLLMTTEDKHI